MLIVGAAGGVGTFAVQIGKWLGAHLTGVCSTRNVAFVQSIGADRAIDYTLQDFTRCDDQYDVIFDLVGNHPRKQYGVFCVRKEHLWDAEEADPTSRPVSFCP